MRDRPLAEEGCEAARRAVVPCEVTPVMSDYGDIDEDVALLVVAEVERTTPLKHPGKAARSAAAYPNIPDWARVVEPCSPQSSDYESSSGAGNSRKEKAARDRRIRKRGRDVTPDWVEVPSSKRYQFSKFSDFGQGLLTLMEWRSPRPRTPERTAKSAASALCGNMKCSGQHSLADCPWASDVSPSSKRTVGVVFAV